MRAYRTRAARERARVARLTPDPAAHAAVLLARIHDAASELLALAATGPLGRLRVPVEQVRGAALRAAAKLDAPYPTPRA